MAYARLNFRDDAPTVDVMAKKRDARTIGDASFMLSLARGLTVIRAFRNQPLTVREISKETGLPPASVRRCLHTLCALGYATQAEGTYDLAPAVLALGRAFIQSTPLIRAAEPVLERLAERFDESCSI